MIKDVINETAAPNSGRIPIYHSNIISPDAVNHVTERLYFREKNDSWVPDKFLQPTGTSPQNIDVENFCAPVVHPVTGETITSYKKLAQDPITRETWTTALGK